MQISEKALKKLNNFFEALSVVSEGNYVYVTDIASNYGHCSKNAVDFFGLSGEYIENPSAEWLEHVHPDDRENYLASMEQFFKGKISKREILYRVKAADGSYAICTCVGIMERNENDEPEYFCGTIKNHAQHSYIDYVTGLRSLYAFLDDLKSVFMRRHPEIVLLLGVNNLSSTNDMLGYSAGNRVLLEIGKMLLKMFGSACPIYHMDGSKFAVIAYEKTIKNVRRLCEKFQNELTHNFYLDGICLNLSLNAGALIINKFNISAETVYSCLKYAYYESKNKHYGKLTVFEDILTEDTKTSLERLSVIRNSIVDDCKGFFLCYQPIVCAQTSALRGAEALIRFENEKYGLVPPLQFVPMLEQDVLFPELGLWILKTALKDCKKILEKYPDFVINVNVSYVQLEQRGFVSKVVKLLEQTGFPGKNLCIEITERCRLLDRDLLKRAIKAFKKYDIKVALDDFGMGYSSIDVLRDIVVDAIKIDREFVKNVDDSQKARNAIHSIVNLAKSFGAKVCAEGVETREMQNVLSYYEVHTLQGFYFSKPVKIADFYKKYL